MSPTRRSDATVADAGTDRSPARLALLALLPVALLAGLLWLIAGSGALDSLRGTAPPIEDLVFQRVELNGDGLVVDVLNNGPDPVQIAQVMVDEAYWQFEQRPAGPLAHLGRATLRVPYPWVEGEAHEVVLISNTGVTFDHVIEVALETPRPTAASFGLFTLIGVYVGVLPIALGLLWLPMVQQLGARALEFVMALTLGLLLFLLVDTTHEGLEAARGLAGSLQGLALFAFASVFAYLLIEALGGALKSRRGGADGWNAALLVAIGIGLHNLGEGLAIGAAFVLGEVALGGFLIIGFALHNSTEGLAIVAPLANEPVRLRSLALLGLIAGAPTILGTWLGGFVYSSLWSVLFLGIGAGAIAQVIVQIARSVARRRTMTAFLQTRPVLSGLATGFFIMYFTGLLLG